MAPSKYDQIARASDPGRLSLSLSRLKFLHPEYFRRWFRREKGGSPDYNRDDYVANQLSNGDSRAAIVVSTKPLLVAAFTDELDCISMLRFPRKTLRLVRLSTGDRLLTVNSYFFFDTVVSDLFSGPRDTGRYQNFYPVIADFYSEDTDRIDERKKQISDEEWRRAEKFGQNYLAEHPGYTRDGCPYRSMLPGTPVERHSRRNNNEPRLAVTPAAIERLLEDYRESDLNPDSVTVVFFARSEHPEFFERDFGIYFTADLKESAFAFSKYGPLHIAIQRNCGYAYQNIVLGYDTSRGALTFRPIE